MVREDLIMLKLLINDLHSWKHDRGGEGANAQKSLAR